MFGTWISDVQQALLTAFPANTAYTAEDLKSPQMPSALGHFLGHALKRRAARIEFSVESDWFDAQAPDVLSALETYRSALTATARYPESVWKSSLERGAQIVISFLIHPANGLVTFVFGEATDPIAIPRVRERMGYFGSHTDLLKAVANHLETLKTKSVGPADLRIAVLKADRSMVAEFDVEDWVDHLAPLYEMAALVHDEEQAAPAIPSELLKSYFEEKDCVDIVRRLEAVESVKGAHSLTLDVVKQAVREPEPIVEEPAVEVEAERPVQIKRVVRNDVHRDTTPEAVPRWMQFAGGGKAAEERPEQGATHRSEPLKVDDPTLQDDGLDNEIDLEAPGKIGQRAPVPDDLEIATTGDGLETASVEPDNAMPMGSVPRWTQFQESVSPVRPVAPDLNRVESQVLGRLNAVQRAWFINHLFGSDQARWKAVMEMLAKAENWNEASEIIAAEVFERHGVDIYSRPAVDFTNAVEARFR